MIRLLLTGFWVCAITAGASYAVAYWKANGSAFVTKQEYLEGLEYEKTRAVNVPMIAQGSIQGYVVARFVFTVEAKVLHQLSVPPEAFVVDEAFRLIYADDRLDFRNLARYDLAQLTHTVKERVNDRMKADIIQDILVDEFNFVSKDELRR